MPEKHYTQVNIHDETAALVDEARPDEYISRSQWVDGTMWRFYGHLLHGERRGRRLTERERIAMAVLVEEGDVSVELLTQAFGVCRQTVRSEVQRYTKTKNDPESE